MNENAADFRPETDNVFARIAGDYDRYCDYFSFYIQRLWKRAFTAEVMNHKGDWLDLASGTGDIPVRVFKNGPREGRVDVTDVCQPMLDMAVAKLSGHQVGYAILDACNMREVPDNSYDVISMAFALKIIDRERALREILRCLKPGGIFLNIDASRIGWKPLQTLYLTYMHTCLPVKGRLIAHGDQSAYDYLLRGINSFPSGPDLAKELRTTGFSEVSYRHLTFGIVAIHKCRKPKAIQEVFPAQ